MVEITRKLLDYLLSSGDLVPGDRIPSERQLAKDLGVGRSPVREALKSLSVMGMLDVRQGDGTYLRRPDSELLPKVIEWGLLLGEQRVMDLVEARQIIEVATSRLAAERADDAVLSELRELVEAMNGTSDAHDFVEIDIAFHLKVAEAAGNTALSDVLKSIQSLLRVWIARVMDDADNFATTIEEHAAVLRAIEAGDSTMSAQAMSDHMSQAAARLAASINGGAPTGKS